ncbi:hypothetical protein K523DRAFT_326113 [Schizophyllum commune Tattone D]|nr:hypothetical protein K523DRAFT_326113 [Schizophyllum commune Tattone D]
MPSLIPPVYCTSYYAPPTLLLHHKRPLRIRTPSGSKVGERALRTHQAARGMLRMTSHSLFHMTSSKAARGGLAQVSNPEDQQLFEYQRINY